MRLFGRRTYYYRYTWNKVTHRWGANVMDFSGHTLVMTPITYKNKLDVYALIDDVIDGNLVEVKQ